MEQFQFNYKIKDNLLGGIERYLEDTNLCLKSISFRK